MPPRTKMTPSEVVADLEERKVYPQNPLPKQRSESNSDLTRDPKDYSPLRTPKPEIGDAWGNLDDLDL